MSAGISTNQWVFGIALAWSPAGVSIHALCFNLYWWRKPPHLGISSEGK